MTHCIALLLQIQLGLPDARITWFKDDFNRSEPGAQWKQVSGSWSAGNGILNVEAGENQSALASTYCTFGTTPYSFEVAVRGSQPGLYFNMDDTTTTKLSQIVRFDRESVLTGYFDAAGEYIQTGRFPGQFFSTEWTLLRVDVYPGRKRYGVFLNGQRIGVDSNLVFPSGYIGLHASEGFSEFRSVKISWTNARRRPPVLRKGDPVSFHHLRYVQSQGKNLVIYSRELKALQLLGPEGKFIRQKRPVQARANPTRTGAAGHTYEINGNRILIMDGGGSVVDSISAGLTAPAALLVDSSRAGRDSIALYVTDMGAKVILKFDGHGKLLATFPATEIGGFLAPGGLDFYGKDELVIADYNRLVFVKKDGTKPRTIPTEP